MERRGLQLLAVSGLFILLTVVMTWPQALELSSVATPHQDVYFNMWRLRWFAHALATPSASLFDANIFSPELRTLALSDAMFVEGIVAAPLLWAGLKPVLVHNLLLLGAMAGSGVAMFALARYLTGSRAAGVVAGIVFSFAPYRFEHVMHMELQWAMWSPLAFLALHRTLDTGKWKYGLATGTCLALQMLSSIYYGIFLASLIAIGGPLLLLARDRQATARRTLVALAGGAALAIVVSGIYAMPYLRVHDRVGDRPASEVATYGARPSSYLAATPNNWLYGRTFASRGGPERRLFPGVIPVVLALVALLLRVPSRRAIVYLLLLVAAFEMSLGLGGYSFTFLYDHVSFYRGLRASARLGIFVLMFLGVLAAYGYQALAEGRSMLIRVALAAVLALGLLTEYRVTPALAPFTNTAPPVYRILARQPPGVVAEFPVPRADTLPGDEAEYAYMSTFHWFPLVNGYSGNYPPSYLARLDRLSSFPDDRSIRQLRQDNVVYVVVHGSAYRESVFQDLRVRIQLDGALVELGSFNDAEGPAVLYRLRP
jgi:hypothetical protein